MSSTEDGKEVEMPLSSTFFSNKTNHNKIYIFQKVNNDNNYNTIGVPFFGGILPYQEID
jgi:hypothetical protein